MKSPYVTDYILFKLTIAAGIFFSLFVWIIGPVQRQEAFTWSTLFQMIGLNLTFIILGFVFTSIYSSGILRVKVQHPVKADDLVVGDNYWLNGETWATFLGIDPYTRRYRFNVFGVKYTIRTGDYTTLLAGEVETYISTIEEKEL